MQNAKRLSTPWPYAYTESAKRTLLIGDALEVGMVRVNTRAIRARADAHQRVPTHGWPGAPLPKGVDPESIRPHSDEPREDMHRSGTAPG